MESRVQTIAPSDSTDDLENLPAERVMSAPAIACSGEAPLEEVVELLADREISGLPVVDADGHVIGILSERDVARALGGSLLRLALHRSSSTGPFLREPRSAIEARRAKDLMTAPPVVGFPNTPLHSLADTMVAHGFNRLPIVEKGRLVGIVTRGDLLRALRGHDGRDGDRPRVILGAWRPSARKEWVTEWG